MIQDLIFDAHLDLGWNAIQWNRDITQSVYTIRTQEGGTIGKGRAQNTVALPEMRRGKVYLCIATLMGRSTGVPVAHVDFLSPMQTYGVARGHLDYYRALEQMGYAKIISDRTGLDAHLNSLSDDMQDDAPPGFIISMESADAILDPADLSDWYAAGVRLIGPAHYGMGRYAGGTGVEEGFTEIGFELLKGMQVQGIILDLTHLSDKAFWEALENFDGHVIASHNNCRALVPHQRQFDDAQIQAIIQRGGVMGVVFDCWMLQSAWIREITTNENVSLETVVDHIDYVCQLAGNSQHVGFGTDLDGGYGREQSPHDLDTIADLQRFSALLRKRGYTDEDISNIFHNNWLRKLKQAWA